MKLKPQNTHKHLTNFISTSSTRPVLQGFHFLENGNVEATDGHKFLRLLTDTGIDKDYVIHPKTLMKIEGNYPKVDHLISPYFSKNCHVSQNDSIALCDFLKGSKKNDVATLTFEQNISVSLENGSTTVINTKCTNDEQMVLNVNATYLKQIFDFIKDITDEEVLIGVISEEKQMVVKKDDLFIAMLFPIKMAKKKE
ncbi:hypothetical protein [Enterococcus sp. AZ126]|uniref:hypothetical protein n=1 Tax=Enterococcus sp. AZ126 TaxID=2774635 RepID=UPI003F285FBC